jgi:hypothetical protein
MSESLLELAMREPVRSHGDQKDPFPWAPDTDLTRAVKTRRALKSAKQYVYPYVKVKLPDGRTRDAHRVLMEAHLGRELGRNEVVHHINGKTRDNRIENLQLMSLREHSLMHYRNGDLPVVGKKKIARANRRASK